MDDIYFRSVLTCPPVILTRQLYAFSSFHALLLMAFESPFLVEGSKKDHDDVILFLWICSTRYEDRLRYFAIDESHLAEITEWGKRSLGWDVNEVVEEIHAYLESYMHFPKIWIKEGLSTTSGLCWPFKLVATILSHYPSYSEVDAWNLPINYVAALRAHVAEEAGMEVVTPAEQGIIDRVRAAAEKETEQKATKKTKARDKREKRKRGKKKVSNG